MLVLNKGQKEIHVGGKIIRPMGLVKVDDEIGKKLVKMYGFIEEQIIEAEVEEEVKPEENEETQKSSNKSKRRK